MIPQYSWRCDGMRVRAPTDAASEKARDRGEAKRQYAAQQMDLPSRTDASNRKHFLPSRSAAPDADSQGLQSHQWSHARPTSIHGVALSRASSRSRCVTGSIPAPRCRARPARNAAQIRPQRRRARATPPMAPSMRPIRVPKNRNTPKIATFLRLRIAAGVKTRIDARKSGKSDAQRPISTSRRTERSPQSQKSCTEVGIFVSAKRIVATEQFLRKTRVPSMPIRPSSSTEPQRIDHTSTHALTLGKDPALARLKNATSEEKRWAK